MMKEETHIFQGMRRDNHQIRQDGKFLWDAHNIRLTNRDDSTFLSITNEKGTSNPLLTFEGYYVGHCVLGKYLVVFTADKNGSNNYIYRVEKTDSGYISIILFHEPTKWEHCWSPENPIEAIGVYETELVQKIYWVDGVNQPRVINITKPELKLPEYIDDGKQPLLIDGVNLSGPSPHFSTNPSIDQYLDTHYPEGFYTRDSFDFVRELQLKEWVDVTKIYGQGEFSPGTIQYALSYYDKYGQESNIFYITPICYISHSDRGGDPEDKIANSFKLEIGAFDNRFEYIRIYSIHRTSIDATPTVKVVGDVKAKYPVDGGEEDKGEHITFIDTGNIGYTIDDSQLLYIGGSSIIAGCITEKDGTLFLGNIRQVSDSNYNDVKSTIQASGWELEDWETASSNIPLGESGVYYDYTPALSSSYSAGFTVGETYRLGLQVQYSDGKWSQPFFLKDDKLCKNYPWEYSSVMKRSKAVKLPKTAESSDSPTKPLNEKLLDLGVRRIRTCIVFPSPSEREVICQGVLCPTVFSVAGRRKDSPYAMSSWFFRPPVDLSSLNNEGDYYHGTSIEFRHNYALKSGDNRGAEIQSMLTGKDKLTDISNDDAETYSSHFFVDENIVTFHSPDLEFDTNLHNYIWDNTSLRIVGMARLGAISGDINIETSSPTINKSSPGLVHTLIGYQTGSEKDINGGLVMGNFYRDYSVHKVNDKFEPLNEQFWPVYPWHRSGSLNNDVSRASESNTTRSSVLLKKKISNLKFFDKNVPLGGDSIHFNISTPQLFSSDEVALLKVAPSYLDKQVPYLGNVDNLITAGKVYTLWYSSGFDKELENDAADTFPHNSSEPVRMKYKSSPHLVFSLGDSEEEIPLLPRHNSIGGAINEDNFEFPSWQQSGSSDDRKSYDYKMFGYYNCPPTDQYPSPPESALETCVVGAFFGAKFLYKASKTTSGNQWVALTSSSDNIILKATSDFTRIFNSKYYLPNTSPTDYNGTEYIGKDKYYRVNLVEGGANDEIYLTDVTEDFERKLSPSRANSSTPSFKITQNTFGTQEVGPYLLVGEIIRDSVSNKFGGTTPKALEQNLWLPASKPVNIGPENEDIIVPFEYGDTWYSRYDCLKTYPFTQEDENQVVEIGSFMCETRVNIDGRYDRNRGQLSNLNMTPQNFNLINEVYSQKDNFFNYRILDEDYYKQDTFANQITWSKEKHAGEEIDTWTNITLANTLDMSGDKGSVNALKAWNEYLLCFQDKALSQILFNSRAQIPVSDGIPIEISNGYKVDSSRLLNGNIGCSNKWSIVDTSSGVYFLDSNTDSVYLFNGQIANLSKDRGMDWWARSIADNKIWKPISSLDNGIRAFYDSKYGDVYFTPGPVSVGIQGDALCYSEHIGQFTSFMSYGGTQAMFNYADGFYSIRNSDNQNTTKLFLNNAGKYNDFYGNFKGWNFSFISNQDPTSTKVFDTIELRTDHYNIKNLSRTPLDSCPMNYIQVSNEYQDSGNVPLDNINMRKKFRVWRGLLPRHAGTRERIRNPWAMVTLGWTPDPREGASKLGTNERRAVIHDVAVKYTV